MYRIEFYEKADGSSEILEMLDNLQNRMNSSKDARIQYNQIVSCIELLHKQGTRLSSKITKHIEDDIWELRPGNNRVLYFCYRNGVFVILHSFRKTTAKTPRREIEKAKAERDDYLRRKGD